MDLHKPVDLTNRSLDDLTSEEKWRVEHQKLHEQHKGHEKMHAEMVIVLIITLVVAQICLIEWKKRHYKSYSMVTLLGMWLVPIVLCLRSQWWRFIFVWLLFSCITGLIVRKALQKPIERTTPSQAKATQYYSPQGISTRSLDPSVCAVCGNKLLVSENEEGVIENTYKLSCEHVFHEFCIRGWCIVGKKQTCPYCKEKVDLKKMFSNPWEKPHVLFGQLLDWIRWLVAWQPMVLFLVQGINWALGLE
ncbi:hypothetical protein NQ314_006902 [Rhamnusium bicolor]|uniref:RING-type domain-containing protein n=1 Tax=Rhamnusium bicolor TaxID=1586634 RepID=A0AAV8YUH0_9CUCU|nr:hypothetical protein NQ314_006902 [Rhamnusium bicolor]